MAGAHEKKRDPIQEIIDEALAEALTVGVLDEYCGHGLRLFDSAERTRMTPEACGYLLELSRRGEISRQQMEMVIHYASVMLPAPLDRGDLAELVDNFIFSFPDRSAAARIPGRGRILN